MFEIPLGVVDPGVTAQNFGFDTEPGLARTEVGEVAQLLRWPYAHIAHCSLRDLTRLEEALEGNSVRLLSGQPAQHRDGLAGMNQCHLTGERKTEADISHLKCTSQFPQCFSYNRLLLVLFKLHLLVLKHRITSICASPSQSKDKTAV